MIDNAENGTKTQKRKEVKNQINLIKKDLKSPSADVLQSDNHYHEWIKLHKPNLYPAEHVNFGYNIEKISEKPQLYLKPMIYICLELENKYKICPYQFLPLRKSFIPKSITIDTSVLVDLFCKNKTDYYKEIESHKEQLWSAYFKTTKRAFRMGKYSFDHSIKTDGFAVSIQLRDEKSKKEKLFSKNKSKSVRLFNTMEMSD